MSIRGLDSRGLEEITRAPAQQRNLPFLSTSPTFIPFVNWLTRVAERRRKLVRQEPRFSCPGPSPKFQHQPHEHEGKNSTRSENQSSHRHIPDTSAQRNPLYLLPCSLWATYIKLHVMWCKNSQSKVSLANIKSGKNILNNNWLLMSVWRTNAPMHC